LSFVQIFLNLFGTQNRSWVPIFVVFLCYESLRFVEWVSAISVNYVIVLVKNNEMTIVL